MERILFDSSSHLGQFCLDNERVRIGCKNMQVSLVNQGIMAKNGAWTDFENGRVDRTIWNLPRQVQEAYYPFMDSYFSMARVDQVQTDNDAENKAHDLRRMFPDLSFYSRINLATAVSQNRHYLYSLFCEMVQSKRQEKIQKYCEISIIFPADEREEKYEDPELELFYQTALSTFKKNNRDMIKSLVDNRKIKIWR